MTIKKIIKIPERFLKIFSVNINQDNRISFKNLYFFIIAFSTILITYIFFSKQIETYKQSKADNFESFVESNDFNDLKLYFLNGLRSPYKEFKYTIQNNDSVEKILNRFNVDYNETKYITSELKKKKLSSKHQF